MSCNTPCPAGGPAALLDPVIDIARRAGERILEVYGGDFAVEHKEDDSPLTAADLAAHHAIVAALESLTPRIPVLSEESGLPDFSERSQWRLYWLVDPLDGTKEFVRRSGEFTVNIALICEHRPVLGVVHCPVLGLTYAGARDTGATRQQGDGPREPIRVRRLPADTVTVVGSRAHGTAALDAYLERLARPHELRAMGSSLKFCLVAEGSADVYPRLGPTSEWDTAAAQAVVEAAGGQVTDTELRPLRYNTRESILNPYFLVFGDPAGDWAAPLARSGASMEKGTR